MRMKTGKESKGKASRTKLSLRKLTIRDLSLKKSSDRVKGGAYTKDNRCVANTGGNEID